MRRTKGIGGAPIPTATLTTKEYEEISDRLFRERARVLSKTRAVGARLFPHMNSTTRFNAGNCVVRFYYTRRKGGKKMPKKITVKAVAPHLVEVHHGKEVFT